ncbi:uncharacterized protein LOC126883487 isoform X2 [Diabrotica virgifera virgifera]|uniref:Uncharacterized protein n=1 Tax=Diabrotica virgifera virgifera TaxID=50390 RepID=A0ABM5K4C0_DIAVI|nr:uncharacterized protein LOC126883487 isoform X2 [Diabrotica virgifera virgifera]
MMAEVQFRMLNRKLNNLFDLKDGKQMTKQEITKRVKECVDHQNFLIDNTDMNYRIEALFHLIAGLNQIVLCYSIPAQALMDQADEVSHSVYFSKWYDYPHYAKHVWQIMVRDARRIEITAGGFVMIDLKMFMAAVKTIISYCMFLRTVSLVD